MAVDLERSVCDDLVLTTLDGGEDFLVSDLADLEAVTLLRRERGRVVGRLAGPLRALHANRMWSVAALPLPGDPADPDFLTPVRRSRQDGVLAALDPDRPLRFRVGAAEQVRAGLIDRVSTELGWVNDPGGWDVNLTARADGGWLAEVGALSWRERHGALERRPWSTTPLVAETMTRLLKPTAGGSVLDPCCGTGTLLAAVGNHVPDARLFGTDRDPDSIELARRNLTGHGVSAELTAREATPIVQPAGSLDGVICNLPFGKQVGSHEENAVFYPELAHQLARALTRSGRAVLLTEDKALLVDAVRRAKGLRISKERVLRYGGATPTAYLLTRSRR